MRSLDLEMSYAFLIDDKSEALPDAVVYPENVEQISKIVAYCNQNKIPVIPWGAGSGFEGGVNAVKVVIMLFKCFFLLNK